MEGPSLCGLVMLITGFFSLSKTKNETVAGKKERERERDPDHWNSGKRDSNATGRYNNATGCVHLLCMGQPCPACSEVPKERQLIDDFVGGGACQPFVGILSILLSLAQQPTHPLSTLLSVCTIWWAICLLELANYFWLSARLALQAGFFFPPTPDFHWFKVVLSVSF